MAKIVNISQSNYNALLESGENTILNLNGISWHVTQILRDRIYIRSNEGKSLLMLIPIKEVTPIKITDRRWVNKRKEFLKSINVF
jgi:hypothetical protein